MPTNPSTIITRPTSSKYSPGSFLRRPPRAASDPEQLPTHQAQNQEPVEDADHPQVESHVAVEDVAELVGDDALQLIARHLIDAALGHADHRVARREAGGEGIDAFFVVHDEHRRHRHTRGERHFFDDVQQPPFTGLERIRIDAPPAQSLGHARPTAAPIGRS